MVKKFAKWIFLKGRLIINITGKHLFENGKTLI